MPKETPAQIERAEADADLLPHYDFSKGVRGKYVQRLAAGSNVVVLAPDVAARFPDSDAVNEALRALVHIAERQVKPSTKGRQAKSKQTLVVHEQP